MSLLVGLVRVRVFVLLLAAFHVLLHFLLLGGLNRGFLRVVLLLIVLISDVQAFLVELLVFVRLALGSRLAVAELLFLSLDVLQCLPGLRPASLELFSVDPLRRSEINRGALFGHNL